MHQRLVLPLLLLAYFLCYIPYIILGRTVGTAHGAVTAFPVYAASCGLGLVALGVVTGRWRLVNLRDPRAWAAAFGSILILASSTLIYMWPKGAIVYPQQLMKAGSLVVAGALDGGGLRWLPLTLCMWAVVLGGLGKTGAAIALPLFLGAGYVLGYLVKLAGLGPRKGAPRFLESELAATVLLLAPITVVWAWLVPGEVPWGDSRAWMTGVLSQGTGIFGTMVLLLKKPHSICASVSRAASLLAGLAAALWLGQAVSAGEWVGAAILVAVLVLAL